MIKNQQEQLDLNVTPIVASPDPIINTAVVSSDTLDQNDNNEASESTTVEANVDLSVTNTVSPDPAYQNESVLFTIGVTNNGESVANNVTVVDTLPNGFTNVSVGSTEGWSCSSNAGEVTCTVATLAAFGGTADFTITATPTIVGNYTNDVSVTSEETSTADFPSAAFDVLPSVDLGLTKSGAATAVVGDPFNYWIDVVNNGPSTATGVTIVDTLPTGVTLEAASNSCDLISPVEVFCNVGELIPDMEVSVTLTVTSEVTGTLRNEAEVTANEHELSNATRNKDIHDTDVSSARAPQALGDAPSTAWFSGRRYVNRTSFLLREYLL